MKQTQKGVCFCFLEALAFLFNALRNVYVQQQGVSNIMEVRSFQVIGARLSYIFDAIAAE